jgi:hypothetical protein
VLGIRLLGEALEGIDAHERARSRSIPPRPEIRQPLRILELAGEAEGADQVALGRAPRVVAGRGEGRASVVEDLADAAKGITGVPGRRTAGLGSEAVEAVEVGGFVKPLSPTLHGQP